MPAKFDQVFFLHGPQQAADSLTMGMQLIGDLLMGNV